MEGGGYRVVQSALDSPIRTNEVGGKRKGRRRGRGRKADAAPGESWDTRGAAVFLLHSAKVRRNLGRLKAVLANVKDKDRATASPDGQPSEVPQLDRQVGDWEEGAVAEPAPESVRAVAAAGGGGGADVASAMRSV